MTVYNVSPGQTSVGITLNSGDFETVSAGGTTVDTTINAGGSLFVYSGGTAIDTTVTGNGTQLVLSGGVASGATVNSGGSQQVWLGGSAGGTTLNAHEYFHLFPDGGGGTLITVDSVACYRRGTRLRTDRGEVVVEALRIGDLLLTRAGEARPIRWIGHRRVDCRRHKEPSRVWPVRIRAGAFNDDVPHSDLWLSPDHAVFVAGVHIPIRHLINSGTIAQVPQDHVTYYHVELPDHDLLLAEGLPAESYLDVGDRLDFDDAGMPIRLFPRFAPGGPGPRGLWECRGCASLVIHGPRLEAARRLVASRAAAASRMARASEVNGGRGQAA